MSTTHYDKVIVFGPTGGVGSSAALEASKRGAQVWLAMRDTSKTISAISSEQEASGSFHRIKADLSDSNTVKEAITSSGAKAAFVYHVRSQDGMLSSLTAMKEAGIEYIVFLSSYSLKPFSDNIPAIPPSDLIPFVHSRVEANLQDLGIPHVALRPAQFATNPINLSLDKTTSPWSAIIPSKDIKGDGITPIDIGRVAGSVLVEKPAAANPSLFFYLCGPQILNEAEKWETIKRATGKEIDVQEVGPEAWGEFLIKNKSFPPPMVQYFTGEIMKMTEDHRNLYSEPDFSEAVGNIKKYSGYEPTTYEEFFKTYQFD